MNRIHFEVMHVQSGLGVASCVDRICARPRQVIEGIVIDAMAFRHLPGNVSTIIETCDSVFMAFLPHLKEGARVVCISSIAGASAPRHLSVAKCALLFRNVALAVADVQSMAQNFAAEVAETRQRRLQEVRDHATVACSDADGLLYALLHALVLVWHHQHRELGICAVAAQPGAQPDLDEASVAVQLLSETRSWQSLAGRLFGKGAALLPWVPDEMGRPSVA